MREIEMVVLLEEPQGFYGYSPQVPGLAFGRATWYDFTRDLPAALKFAGLPAATQVNYHFQVSLETADGAEIAVRIAQDDQVNERQYVERMVLGIAQGEDLQEQRRLAAETPDTTGVVIYVCALPTDSIGWLTRQMGGERGEVVVAALAAGEKIMFSMRFGSGAAGTDGWPSIEDSGWSLATPLGQVMARLGSAAHEDRAVLV